MFEPRPLTETTLGDLLNEGTERAGLDYKARCDLNDSYDKVAIVKDIAAMQLRGGYIVIGADNNGHPTGQVTEAEASRFDQATVHSKAQRYLAEGFEVRSTALQVDENWFGLVCVLPHPHAIAPMKVNGTYRDDEAGRDRSEFSAGDVFARHGTRSERWNLEDVRALREEIRSQERDLARAEFGELFTDLQRTMGQVGALATGVVTTLDWNLTPDALCSAVVEQVRRQDTIPVNLLISHAQRDIQDRVQASTFDDAELILDHLVCLAATFITIELRELAQRVIQTLFEIYDGAFRSEQTSGAFDSRRAARVGLQVITRSWALGALGVRRREWWLAPLLAGHRPDADGRDHYTTWLFHGAVMAARADLRNTDRDPTRGISVLVLAQEHVARLGPLRPDLSDGEEVGITSLCQFDMLACFVAIRLGMDTTASGRYLAQFGRWYAVRSDPAAIAVIQEPEVRELVFPKGDHEVALALLSIAREAQRMAGWFSGWDGYSNPQITAFIELNTTVDERVPGGASV